MKIWTIEGVLNMEFKLDEATKRDINLLVNAYLKSFEIFAVEYLEEKGISVSSIEFEVNSVNVDTFMNYNFDLLEKENERKNNCIFDITKERK